ncbi:DUF4149 domain-containing protein [Halobacterium jilantaiense]|uniref:TMEM205-like domain-containing protein n=1 Tax=Halobacterium jilantaiense TaxID=355548 RepID=A0A1I0NDC7_9EURY|nr:DUF4149 domain-containing protein [Halobacterium jilantaiense]SEV99267.1 protein of unknown function [Halobacterium jilantaiense]
MTVADTLVTGALGVWLGSIVFFSFVAAPALFSELGSERAGDAVNVVFPRYYVFGVAMAAVALAAWIVGPLAFGTTEPPLAADAGVFMGAAANIYARYVLVPKMEAAGSDAFAQYHKQSVALNLVTLTGVAVAFVSVLA